MACQHLYKGSRRIVHPTAPNTNPYGGNITIVNQVHAIQEKLDPVSFVRPEEDALVIHLRLGDILENAQANVSDMLIAGADPGWKGNHRKGIKSVREFLENIHDSGAEKVRIIGGSHRRNMFMKSRVYAGCIYRAVQAAGYNVTMRIEGVHPDVDFYYISHAKKIVVSAGGYSNLMGQIAESRGGQIIGRKFSIHWAPKKKKKPRHL
eukprot:CAMPEP_0178752340 /NCGR_PEP_ID=MMETSP0744-20121128/11012_1 /TAXON_ID=913974 /ORGANISM="Nitzschia punctata, Strain CCMP561" /LENGTH=206 /DNA_ID=CAMNT_0020406055 /DNA_START=424 /DNA_END=1044 /DNA_ORIENTATION=+